MGSATPITCTLRSTSTPNVDISKLGVMTWSQIHDLAADDNDIGDHTLTHVSLTDPNSSCDRKWDQTCDDRRRLQTRGFDPVNSA